MKSRDNNDAEVLNFRLSALAVEITTHLRAHFPDSDERIRQVLALAEEAGEAQEAYLLSLSGGPRNAVAAELADVIVTAYVTAVVLGIDLSEVKPTGEDSYFNGWQYVMDVGAKAGGFVGAYRRWAGMARRSGPWRDVVSALTAVVRSVYAAADALDIDLDAAVVEKTELILSRGWRDRPAGEVSQ